MAHNGSYLYCKTLLRNEDASICVIINEIALKSEGFSFFSTSRAWRRPTFIRWFHMFAYIFVIFF